MEHIVKVLIADENAEERRRLKTALAAVGITSVDETQNGDETLRRLASVEYSAAVIDLWLSGIDGIGIIRRHRASENGTDKHLYLIVTAGTKGSSVLFEAAAAGADMCVPKPYSPDSLAAHLASVTSRNSTLFRGTR